MDPDANLEEQRRIVEALKGIDLSADDEMNEAERLVVLVESLDEWLSKGGFLPQAWQRHRRG
jgi:hypothetical protein